MRPRSPLPSFLAAARTANFLLKALPIPDRPVEFLSHAPRITNLTYETRHGRTDANVYRPHGPGPHPGVVVSLGVVPFGAEHPQVPRLGSALARSGFAALLHWSPAMRDLRLESGDAADVASAYAALLAEHDVDAGRSGLLGTCVGGAFALMAAADPRVLRRVSFVAAIAPYSSMRTFIPEIASASKWDGHRRIPWEVDDLTRSVFARTLTNNLDPAERDALRDAFVEGRPPSLEVAALSPAGRAVQDVLFALTVGEAAQALYRLPPSLQTELDALSPLAYVDAIEAPLIVFGHDRSDNVIPIAESRRLHAALRGRRGVRYTEFTMFQHLDPAARKLAPPLLARELAKFFAFVYSLFRQAGR